MAPKKPKKPSPLEVPPAVSSSEEEEVSSGEEEVESQEEEEVESQEEKEEDANTEQNHKLPTKKAASSEEEGSESESDSDHPPRGVADPNVKPVDDASKLKKPRSKPTASPSVVAVTPTRSASKRRVENENRGGDGKDSKRAKKKVPEAASGDAVETTEKENQPKKLFKRVWSEEDEVIILKGMKDFSLKKGTDPITDFDRFNDFIKNSLHIDFTRTQLNDKMRKLKKKYLTNADKKKNGADRTFSKPHWQNVFNLSKEMWGTETNIGVGADAPPKKDIEDQKSGPSQAAAALEEYVLLNQTITTSGLDAKLIKEGLSLIDSYKKSELEEEWRELQMAEAQMFLRRIEFARKQTKIALDALKKH